MSNYYCPRCGKAIIDNPRGPDNIHTCTPKDVIERARNIPHTKELQQEMIRNAFIAEAM